MVALHAHVPTVLVRHIMLGDGKHVLRTAANTLSRSFQCNVPNAPPEENDDAPSVGVVIDLVEARREIVHRDERTTVSISHYEPH